MLLVYKLIQHLQYSFFYALKQQYSEAMQSAHYEQARFERALLGTSVILNRK